MLWLKKNKLPTLMFILIFFLRLPSLFEPFTYGDEGIYLTLGQAVRHGLVLYRDIHDNKPPLLYLLAAIANNFSYFRLLLFGWSLLTIYIFFKMVRLVFSQNQTAVIISTLFFAILTSVHTFEGNVANAENFMLLPTISGFLLILRGLKSKRLLHFFLAGTLFSLASLFKVPAVFDFLAAIVYVFLISLKNKRSIIHYLISTTAGFIPPILITFIYFGFQKALPQYLAAAFFQNIPYLSSWTPEESLLLHLPISLLNRVFLVGLTTFIIFILRRWKIG